MKLFFALFISVHAASKYPLEKLKVPAGYRLSLYAEVPGARSMCTDGRESVYVGTGGFTNPKDKVYRVRDWNKDGTIQPDEVEILISGLDKPNGVAYRKGALYIAQVNRILEFRKVDELPKGGKLKLRDARVLPKTFPSESWHGWRYIRFAPPPDDAWLYIGVGAPCNVCKREEPFSSIARLNIETGKFEIVARGVRNSVGFDFHPQDKHLWFTDNGRDRLGDTLPHDELNRLEKPGDHFGFPYCYDDRVHDPEFPFDQTVSSCSKTQAPAVLLGPHVAALGMRFSVGKGFPSGAVFLAEHGSGDSSKRVGSRVTLVKRTANEYSYEPFITGWLNDSTQKRWGRPVDVEFLNDGSMLISDDGIPNSPFDGAIYRVQSR